MSRQNLVQIFILLLLIPCWGTAQVESHSTRLENEVGVSLMTMNTNYGLEYASDYYVTILNGIGYKRHLGHHALRLGGAYRDSRAVGHGDFIGESTFLEGKFNLGYQLTFSDKAINPYMAVDFIYLVAELNSDFVGGFLGLYSESNLRYHGIGYAPSLGVYFRINESFSFLWEGNVEFLWIKEKGTIIRSEPHDFQSRTTYQISRRDDYWLLNPLKSISLNYGF
jgi:hypothetical protein